jgi:hypothetical protein
MKTVKPRDCVTLPEFLAKRVVENAGPSFGLLELYNPKLEAAINKKINEETTKKLQALIKNGCDQWYVYEFDKKRGI